MGQAVDKKTMAICFGKVEGAVSKIKRTTEECEELIRYLTSAGVQQSLAGGDGDIIVEALKSGISVLTEIQEKEKADVLDVLDEKIAAMKTVTTDQSDVASKTNKLKENASTVNSLKR